MSPSSWRWRTTQRQFGILRSGNPKWKPRSDPYAEMLADCQKQWTHWWPSGTKCILHSRCLTKSLKTVQPCPLANLDANLQHHQGGFSGLHTGIPNRSDGFGVVTTLTPPPVTGITSVPPLGSPVHSPMHIVGRGGEQLMSPYYSQLAANLPQLNFPQFDGHHPKMWKAKSESYFEVFSTLPELWVKIATLHFTSSTAF